MVQNFPIVYLVLALDSFAPLALDAITLESKAQKPNIFARWYNLLDIAKNVNKFKKSAATPRKYPSHKVAYHRESQNLLFCEAIMANTENRMLGLALQGNSSNCLVLILPKQ